MRLLFTTTGHSGHLLPLVPLARAAERAGHHVEFAAQASRAPAIERDGFRVHPLADASEATWAPFMRRLPGLRQSDGDAFAIGEGFARIGAGAALDGMLGIVEQVRPNVLVHEGYEFAGPIAAALHGVPTARVALGLASTEAWMTRLAAPAVGELRARHGLPPAGEDSRPLISAVPPGLDDGRALRFGPAAPSPAPPLPDWWANPQDPLVYLTFGSVSGSLPLFPGLYDAVLDALAPLPVRVLLTLGRDADPAALGPLPANAHLEPWVAQDDVLAHAAVVVSHGGYGTTLGALHHGVPLVLLPLFAGDQWRNARRVAALGAGILLEDGERLIFDPPGPELLAALPGAILRVLDDARFGAAAARLGLQMRALPAAGEAVAALAARVRAPATR